MHGVSFEAAQFVFDDPYAIGECNESWRVKNSCERSERSADAFWW